MYSREHKIGALVTALFSLIVYLLTVAPTVTFWDAGEFMAAAYSLGIPHAPGTPLFVLIGRVMSILPLGLTPAFKMNLVSVLSGTVASGLLYLIGVSILERIVEDFPGRRWVVRGGAFCAGVIFTGLRTVWLNTTEFEVYGLATATILLVSWLLIYMAQSEDFQRTRRVLLLAIYLVSLSIANHLIVMLVAPAVAIFTLLHDREHRNYWLSVLGMLAGTYLLVVKGIDLGMLAESIHGHTSSAEGAFSNAAAVISGLFELFASPGDHLASGGSAFLGLVLIGVCGWWSHREKSLPFFWTAAGLFVLGFSIQIYLPIRAALDPAINMGNPDSMRNFWAVIGREQYGSTYGILPRQVWTLLTGKTAIHSASDLFENISYFFKYNLPFYNQYLGWQFGNSWITALFLILAVAGAVRHFTGERKTFWFWLAVFLLTGPILNAYMNFQFGFSQFPEVQLHPAVPNMRLHEPRERDYFFIVSFAFLALWAAFGLAVLAGKLVKLISERIQASAGTVLAVLSGLVVFAPSILPVALNWEHADRSGNYIPRSYALNVMNSLAPNSMLFTNGDNDTFPLWYIQEVEGVRKDCRVVNLSLLNLPWYIRQMRDMEPKVPFSTPDQTLDLIGPTRSNDPKAFQFGDMRLDFPAGTVFYVKDLMVLDILRSNAFRRPIYMVTSIPAENRTGLNDHLVMEGVALRITEQPSAQVAGQDSSVVLVMNYDTVGVNVPRSYELLTEVYNYDTFFRPGASGELENNQAVRRFAIPASYLENAFEMQGDLDKALEMTYMANKFYGDLRQYIGTITMLLGRTGRYDSAAATLIRAGDTINTADRVQLNNNLAKIAANNRDFEQSLPFLERIIELDPTFRPAYGSGFMLLNYLKRRDDAVGMLERYLQQFPADTAIATALDKYRQGGDIDVQRAFGFGR
jgi:hypothetical protein